MLLIKTNRGLSKWRPLMWSQEIFHTIRPTINLFTSKLTQNPRNWHSSMLNRKPNRYINIAMKQWYVTKALSVRIYVNSMVGPLWSVMFEKFLLTLIAMLRPKPLLWRFLPMFFSNNRKIRKVVLWSYWIIVGLS